MCTSTAQARRIWVAAAGASSDCALVVVPCAFSCMVITFRGRRKGNLVFWCFKVDFFVTGARDRSCFTSKCSFRGRHSTWDMVVISWQLRFRDRCSEFRDFWTCGSFADFVAGTALGEPRSTDFVAGTAFGEPRSADFVAGAALGEPRSADFVAGATLGEPRSADFVAGAALGEPRSADFVAGTALCEPRSADFVAGAVQHLVNLEVQISHSALTQPHSHPHSGIAAHSHLDTQILTLTLSLTLEAHSWPAHSLSPSTLTHTHTHWSPHRLLLTHTW